MTSCWPAAVRERLMKMRYIVQCTAVRIKRLLDKIFLSFLSKKKREALNSHPVKVVGGNSPNRASGGEQD